MGVFIKVSVDDSKCLGVKKSGHCVNICPVNIFEAHGERVTINEENEDECTLCELCLQKCDPNAITIQKLYEQFFGEHGSEEAHRLLHVEPVYGERPPIKVIDNETE